jgi:putative redox protein
MSDAYRVTLRTVAGGPTAIGSAGPHALVVDRPASAGGGGLGFNGGQLLYLAIAGCISNDLYREAGVLGIAVTDVAVDVDGDFPEPGSASTPITVAVDLDGDAPEARLRELLDRVVEMAEIPKSLRGTTPIEITARRVSGRP